MSETEHPYREIADWIMSDGDSLPAPIDPADAPPIDGEGADAAAEPRAWGFSVERMNEEYALVTWGSKAVVVKEQPGGPIEDRVRILGVDAFRVWFANEFTEIRTSDGKIKAVTHANAWLQHRKRRQYHGVEFFPNPDGAHATPGYLNLWRGFAVTPSEEGTCNIFYDHLRTNVCGGDEALFRWVFGWFAHMIQRPRERAGTALVLRGGMGVGKSKIGEVIGSLFPAHFFQVDDPRYITGQFNAHQASCLLLQAEEAMWAGDKAAEGRIKGLITSSQQMIEAKGIDPIRIQNYVRVLMTSNEDWVVPAGMGERRFCVLDVDPRCMQNHAYFREMDEELAAGGLERLLYDLQQFDLGNVNLRFVPRTRALLEQKMRTFDPVDSWWLNRLQSGFHTGRADTWGPEVACTALYEDYVRFCEELGVGRKRDSATFGVQIAKRAPGLVRRQVRRRYDDAEAAKRVWVYSLPSLVACREAFDKIVGQPCDWPVSGEGESGEPGEAEMDADDYCPL